MNEEQPSPDQPADAPAPDAPAPDAPAVEAKPEEARGPDPRRRLRELLAIPERERSDAVWDEIIDLEIELAPGNRAPIGQPDQNRQPPGMRQDQGRRPDQARRQGQQPGGGKPGKRSGQRHGRGPKPGMMPHRKP
ncbi:MAG: hypothetical protein AB7O31_18675 [Burkholderiales bacterium]